MQPSMVILLFGWAIHAHLFDRDPRWLKVLVSLLMVLETANSATASFVGGFIRFGYGALLKSLSVRLLRQGFR